MIENIETKKRDFHLIVSLFCFYVVFGVIPTLLLQVVLKRYRSKRGLRLLLC